MLHRAFHFSLRTLLGWPATPRRAVFYDVFQYMAEERDRKFMKKYGGELNTVLTFVGVSSASTSVAVLTCSIFRNRPVCSSLPRTSVPPNCGIALRGRSSLGCHIPQLVVELYSCAIHHGYLTLYNLYSHFSKFSRVYTLRGALVRKGGWVFVILCHDLKKNGRGC